MADNPQGAMNGADPKAVSERDAELVIQELLQERMAHLQESVPHLCAHFLHLQDPLAGLREVAYATTAETDPLRFALDRTYRQLVERSARLAEDESVAVECLMLLAFYLLQIEQIAHENEAVRAAWVELADVIANEI